MMLMEQVLVFLVLVGSIGQLCFGQEVVVDQVQCVKGSEKFVEWVEDYKDETDEMERLCRADIKHLHTSLIGRHGPPIEVEIKYAACYDACLQYIRNIDYLFEISGCSCAELDEAFPLTEIGHEFKSWCLRRPTEFLWLEIGVRSEWAHFNTRYCKCNSQIACESNVAKTTASILLVMLVSYLN